MRGSDTVMTNQSDPHTISDSREGSQRLDGLTILLVDDSFDNQLLFERILSGAGARVVIAEDGGEAVALEAVAKFDLILMDLMMPNIDGYEATRRIRAHGFVGPIIALTAHASPDAQLRCREAGCTAFALKPIGRCDLLSAVAAAAKLAY